MRTRHEEGADREAKERSIVPAYVNRSETVHFGSCGRAKLGRLLRGPDVHNLHELERDWEAPTYLGVAVADERQSVLCMPKLGSVSAAFPST